MSYLPKKKLARGVRGDDKFLKHFLDGQSKLKDVITQIEDTGEDSTLLALQTYADSGVPISLVSEMLRNIRSDLLEVDREFVKAAEVLQT